MPGGNSSTSAHDARTCMGWATLAVIAIFEFMGVYIIRKIVAIDV
ncbi:hypothetical protein [Verminephrobacter aporrectodeae]|nr:hypothetical protein [Verminephrobacter aporrectodeae]